MSFWKTVGAVVVGLAIWSVGTTLLGIGVYIFLISSLSGYILQH